MREDGLNALGRGYLALMTALLLAGCSGAPSLAAVASGSRDDALQPAHVLVSSDRTLPANAAPLGATPSLTPTPTLTPSPTGTPAPSPPSATDNQTSTPAATATRRPPTRTPTPSATPTPSVDFRLLSWRLWPKELNGGCEKGMHNIFIVTLDAGGQPLSNVVVGDTWNNTEEITGRPGKEPGRVDIPLYANTMEMYVKRDAVTGQPYTSEASPPCPSFITTIPDEQLVQAGYFSNETEAQWNRQNYGYICGGHFSWEVIFQRTW